MKKRIKLTDNELALGSWLYVLLNMIHDETYHDIYNGKAKYLLSHGTYNWHNCCLLCQNQWTDDRFFNCENCPLSIAQKEAGLTFDPMDGCDEGSWYETVAFDYDEDSYQKRISACLNICNVLANELKKVGSRN